MPRFTQLFSLNPTTVAIMQLSQSIPACHKKKKSFGIVLVLTIWWSCCYYCYYTFYDVYSTLLLLYLLLHFGLVGVCRFSGCCILKETDSLRHPPFGFLYLLNILSGYNNICCSRNELTFDGYT